MDHFDRLYLWQQRAVTAGLRGTDYYVLAHTNCDRGLVGDAESDVSRHDDAGGESDTDRDIVPPANENADSGLPGGCDAGGGVPDLPHIRTDYDGDGVPDLSRAHNTSGDAGWHVVHPAEG